MVVVEPSRVATSTHFRTCATTMLLRIDLYNLAARLIEAQVGSLDKQVMSDI